MEKKALSKPHSESHLATIIRILTLGGLEGKRKKNLQRGKENSSRIMGKDSPEHKRNDLSQELVHRGLGNQSPGRKNNSGLSLKPSMLNPNSWKKKSPNCESPIIFMQPQKYFIKLNFEGATKGNPEATGSRGMFRDDKGNIIRLFAMDCDTTSNNEAKLYALKRGLDITKRESFQRLEVEGDSKLVIEKVKKIQQGTTCEKISQS